MVICTDVTMALYCPRCGKLQLHDFNRFMFKPTARRNLVCSCGQVQATIAGTQRGQYLLNIPCAVCEGSHITCLDNKHFWRAEVDKIYCVQENLEVGLIGSRQQIEETIASHKHEFETLAGPTENDDYIENPQIMFEILNMVHDMAERGDIHCHCGSTLIEADVLHDGIELQCLQCGGWHIIRAQCEEDLEYIKSLETLELASRRRTSGKN